MQDNRFDRYYAPVSRGAAEDETRFVVQAHFDSERITLSGSAEAESARARHIRISGSARISGDVAGETLEASGSLQIGGNTSVSDIGLSGSFTSGGDVRSEYCRISGSCRAAHDVIAEKELTVSGSINCIRILSGNSIALSGNAISDTVRAADVKIEGGGRIGVLECTNAEINRHSRGRGLRGLFAAGRRQVLSIDRIDAKGHLFVDACTVNDIMADSVEVGGRCVVGRIVYASSCHITEGAEVRSEPVKR